MLAMWTKLRQILELCHILCVPCDSFAFIYQFQNKSTALGHWWLRVVIIEWDAASPDGGGRSSEKVDDRRVSLQYTTPWIKASLRIGKWLQPCADFEFQRCALEFAGLDRLLQSDQADNTKLSQSILMQHPDLLYILVSLVSMRSSTWPRILRWFISPRNPAMVGLYPFGR